MAVKLQCKICCMRGISWPSLVLSRVDGQLFVPVSSSTLVALPVLPAQSPAEEQQAKIDPSRVGWGWAVMSQSLAALL